MAALEEIRDGESGPMSFNEVYERLRTVAHRERRRFGPARTLNTTALVHEVYLDLAAAGDRGIVPRDFFGYAARSMRNLLTDHARRCLRPKHGGNMQQTDLDSPSLAAAQADASRALELDAALAKLQAVDARAAEVVELHYFAGLGLGQIADLLGVSERTINRDWRAARAWLESELAAL
jgi:RNA polymerase sigma factor (TIGR02999 family)